uniref:ABC transporter ATP-binding protein n=1 Tax=Anaerococcus mediterraneensis TaxID=1870984 RepID=UPI000930ED00|nr:ABC transporter ATP-binding protein [Anaerococcus mediterraneensis]
MENSLLDIKNLNLYIKDKHILKDIDLEIGQGEIVLICGKSGSGKSTFASVLSGYYKNIGGEISFDKLQIAGENIDQVKTYDRHPYALVSFQNARLSLSTNTLREELIFILENLRADPKKMDDIVENQAKAHKLEDILDKKFDNLSGGQLQMAAFCAISMIDSKIYILDEPFANIDNEKVEFLQEFIKKMKDDGKSFIIIDHRLDVWDFVDRAVLLSRDGKILKDHINLGDLTDDDKAVLMENGLISPEGFSVEKNKDQSQKLIRARDLSLSYGDGKILLKDANFDIKKNKMTAITGQSGTGKSSLFKVLLKKLAYDGSVKIDGKEVKAYKNKDYYKNIGLVFQDPTLQFITTSLRDEIKLNMDISDEKISNFLEKYGLDTYLDRSPWTLSQGEQRRLAVVIMVLMGKKILLVDEPTYGQDLENSIKIMDELKDLSKNASIIFTSHDKSLVNMYADEIFEIKDKKVKRLDR